MTRTAVAGCALVAVLVLILVLRPKGSPLPGDGSGPAARRPNVVVVLVDTLRADHLGLHGYERDTSPELDRWAAGAVVFDRAYAPCSWTRPSVVTLFSGLDPIGHGVEDRLDVIPPGLPLLAEQLKAQGYATFAAVTNPNVLPQWGFGRGFDVFADLDSAGHGTRAVGVMDWVEARLDELAGSEPFFLYLHLLDPHGPYDPPPPFDERFPRSPLLPPERSIGRYDGEIAHVDEQFGRLLRLLEARGLAEDSLTLFLADHGEELFDHGAMGHGYSLFEEVVRIPLVIRFPGGEHGGTRVPARASLADVLPTTLGVLGAPVPEGLDGRDLTELLAEREPAWSGRGLALSLRTTGPDSHLVRGWIEGPLKYLRRSRPTALESLYDLDADPGETEDFAWDEPRAVATLSARLDEELAGRSAGLHLRLLGATEGEPVEVEARLRSEGRFASAAPVRLEEGDSFELVEGGRALRLRFRLESRLQVLSTGSRPVPDEDGLVLQLDPPDASLVVEELRTVGGRALPLRTGADPSARPLPCRLVASDPALRVRDPAERGGDAPAAWLGLVRAAPRAGELSPEIEERLRALGYLGGP